MNWMGGNLSRHRRGKGWKEEMARQKEYFAKARSRQREQTASRSPVPLSAANFIPNYTSPSKNPTAGLHEAKASPSSALSPSALGGKPLSAAAEVSTGLGDETKSLPRDVPRLPIAYPLAEDDRPSLSDQAVRDRSIGAYGPEAGFRRLLNRIDSAETRIPRLHLQVGRERDYLTVFSHTSERQQQQGASSGHHKHSEVGRQRDNRKRKLRQATPSPISIKIRVGSQDYRWSESRNSIGIPAYGECLQTQSAAPESPRSKIQSTDVTSASYLMEEVLTVSSSSSSHPTLSSPCKSRASRLVELHNSTSHTMGATPPGFQRPLPECACESAPESPTLASLSSEIDSTDSIAVQASDDGIMPETETDEERIWRQWLG
ncbi:hypothetical protein BBK36DRAFT_1113110 [Trichoderma citrinoviride]|uniref:Uncharacterized protein n=1 Tax=Trichoderma citrinoviride TaxID=58853 RepID=A0A2T4BGS9_9HYPO|nr:hypothetical protein BBK36DRAFT_1113110 [Trichoderma citrinoviride]PTB68526.1 hypothetical protein BBK36DRAFT_1113110 [Trichoderma citrinoviride]